MARKGFTRNFKPLQFLTEEQFEAIHRGTLDILWQTGVKFENDRALKILEKAGCKVDFSDSRVCFPPGLVEESLRKCPSTFRLKARDPKNDLIMGGNTTYFSPFPGMGIVDLDTWEFRTATRKEFYDGVTILDALDTVDLLESFTPYFGFEGVPPCMTMVETFVGKARNSSKFQREGYSNNCEVFNVKIAQALGMEMFLACLPSPPLAYGNEAIEAAFRAVEAGFPVKVGGGVALGATAPTTIAGSQITNNAELIAPIVLLQIVKPGTRIIACNLNYALNMRNGSPAFGDIASSLHTIVFNQIWGRYGIPRSNQATPSSSKRIDFQCGYEKAISALLFAISGGNYVIIHGGIYGEISFHPVQAILDDDLVRMIGRLLEGVQVNVETLALELIEEVGPVPGHYLDKEHTRKWWMKEHIIPKAVDRLTYPEWVKAGKKSAVDYARDRMEEILASHKVSPPLTASQEDDISKILEEAKEYYKKKGML